MLKGWPADTYFKKLANQHLKFWNSSERWLDIRSESDLHFH